MPSGLGKRGSALWEALTADREADAAWLVLAEEACRIADRLEHLDGLLNADDHIWARIETAYKGDRREIRLVFDDALAEARQQANTFRQILASLGVGKAAERKAKELSALDQLAAKRTARRAASSS